MAFFDLKRLSRAIFKRVTLNAKFACRVQNTFQRLEGSDVRFRCDDNDGSYYAFDRSEKRCFLEQERGFKLYSQGIRKRSNDLFSSYCLDQISFVNGDVVVDCGANYGDLFGSLKEVISPEDYFAFEPSPDDFRCLYKNYPDINAFNIALSDRKGVMPFYVSSRGGDSSLVEPKTYTEKIDVEVIDLDHFKPLQSVPKIKLFKLEAEGWEPEIIQGASKTCLRCEYIAIDGGPERGPEEASTFPFLANFLWAHNFELIEICGFRALFKNKASYSKD